MDSKRVSLRIGLEAFQPIAPQFLGGSLLIGLSLSLSLLLSDANLIKMSSDASLVSTAVRAGCLLVLAGFSGTIGSLLGRVRLLRASTAIAATCIAALCLMVFFGGGGAGPLGTWQGLTAVAALLYVVQNAAFAIPYLAWHELYARMDTLHLLLYYTAVRVCSGLYSTVVSAIPSREIQMLVIVATLPVSALLLRSALRKSQDLPFMQGAFAQGEGGAEHWAIPARVIALFAIIAFINAFVRNGSTSGGRWLSVLGVVAVTLVALVLALRHFYTFDPMGLYVASIALLVSGAVYSIADLSPQAVAAMATNGAYALFSVFTMVSLAMFSYRRGANPLLLFGISEASLLVGGLAARLVYTMFPQLLSDAVTYRSTCALLVIAFMFAAMFLVPPGRKADFSLVDVHEAKKTSAQDTAALTSVADISKRFGLTAREEEVLGCLLRGDTLSDVATQLYIAPSTMKTHSRHIYKKLGVSNAEELRAVWGQAHE